MEGCCILTVLRPLASQADRVYVLLPMLFSYFQEKTSDSYAFNGLMLFRYCGGDEA